MKQKVVSVQMTVCFSKQLAAEFATVEAKFTRKQVTKKVSTKPLGSLTKESSSLSLIFTQYF